MEHTAHKNKICCYTCITGNYDSLLVPDVIPTNIDFICYSDVKLTSDIWQIRPIPSQYVGLSNVKQQRLVKICPHQHLADYDISIWVDGNIQIMSDLNDLLAEYDLDSCPFFTRVHPSRNCIYDEAEACLKLKKANFDVVNNQVSRYKAEGYPAHIGMAETCVLLRKHNDRRCVLLDNLWATELLKASHRDQLSFNYACWKLHFLPGYMTKEYSVNNKHFRLVNHGQKVLQFSYNMPRQ